MKKIFVVIVGIIMFTVAVAAMPDTNQQKSGKYNFSVYQQKECTVSIETDKYPEIESGGSYSVGKKYSMANTNGKRVIIITAGDGVVVITER